MDKFNMYALVMDSLNDGAPICVHAVCEDDVINYCFYRDGNGGFADSVLTVTNVL